MLDIKYIREYADLVKKASKEKGIDIDIDKLLILDTRRRELQQHVDAYREERNRISESIGKEHDNIKRNELIAYMQKKKEEGKTLEEAYAKVEAEFTERMYYVPIVHAPNTPIADNETGNVEIFRSQEPPKFDFELKDHIQLGKELDIIDFERGAKVSGYRGYYLKNEAVMLQMGFLMYALKKAINSGYMPIIPPTLVKEFPLLGSGYFSGSTYNSDVDEIYKIANTDIGPDGMPHKEDKFLVGTAEPSLLAYYADEILSEKNLPLKLCGFSQCYRSEIGSYGKDTKGIYRVHEFMKVELVTIAPADVSLSDTLQEEMLTISKELHSDLELPHRVIRICSGDLSVGKYKQFDLEAWLPSRNGWGETGSASNFLDWQARRLNVRYKTHDGDTKHVYMLNDTALPSPRILIALLENHQQKDGSVKVPEVLVPYTGFDRINPKP